MRFGPGNAPAMPETRLQTVIDVDAGRDSQGVVGQRNGQVRAAGANVFLLTRLLIEIGGIVIPQISIG